jgi:hypothetical protein
MQDSFLSGAICMAASVISLFFIRFWRKTHDPLFAFFAAAFAILALERVARLPWHVDNEVQPYTYLARLFAFLLIIVAIIRKNRKSGSS